MSFYTFLKAREEYSQMYLTYLQYEQEFWHWAEMRQAFNLDIKNKTYYRRNNSHNRRKFAEKVIRDYPHLALSVVDLHDQIGGCREIVAEYNLTKFQHDPYFLIYRKLKKNPDLIYNAVEETYEFSIELGVKTTALAAEVPEIIKFIATECVI